MSQKLYLKLYKADGNMCFLHVLTQQDDIILSALEMGILNDNGEELPLVRQPFTQHSELKTLHTICSLHNPQHIEVADWNDEPMGTPIMPDTQAEAMALLDQDDSLDVVVPPCQPIGCDNGHHLPGCIFVEKPETD